MTHLARVAATGLLCLVIMAQPSIAQTEAEKKATVDKAAANKAAADKAAADKAADDKAAAKKPPALDSDAIYGKSAAALTMLFVIAVVLESAFAVLFNWSVFLVYFSVRGVKTIVMIGASWLIVNAYDIDVLASLIAAYKSPPGGSLDPAKVA